MLRARLLDPVLRWAYGRWPLFLACGVLAYFGYHAVHGERGFLAWVDRNREIEAARLDLAQLTAEHDQLQHRIDGLKENALDRDLLEEELRKLGYVRSDEVLVLTPEDAKGAN